MTENDSQTKYREWLVQAEHMATRDYDKAILTLSSGALGISIAFVSKLVPHPYALTLFFLGFAWIALVLSLLSTLISLLTSQIGLRKTIEQVDEGTIYAETPGGWFTTATIASNILAAITLIIGVSFLVLFALINLIGVTA